MKTKYCRIMAIVMAALGMSGCTNEMNKPVLTVGEHEIFREEFDLYREIVKRDMIDREDEKQILENASEYAAECYSLFEIADECGAEEPFSFEEFQKDLENKNNENEEKLTDGDAVMGLIRFDEEDYFEYILAEYRQKTSEKLGSSPDEQMIENAKKYYEEHKDNYIDNIQFKYQYITEENGEENRQTITTDYHELSQSYHSTDMLGDVLMSGELGESYDIGTGTVILMERDVSYYLFEECGDMVVQDYITAEYLPKQIQNRAEKMEIQYDESSSSADQG